MQNPITSRNNENIKYAYKVINSSKFRNKNRVFSIEGLRLCTDALKSGIIIQKTFYSVELYNKFYNEIDEILKKSKECYAVDENLIKLISDTDTPQGIVCICSFAGNEVSLDSLQDNQSIVVLEDIQNPSNLGAIIRTCDALGVTNMVLSKGCCDIYNPKVLRCSMGSVFRIGFFTGDIINALESMNKWGFSTVAMALDKDCISIRDLDKNDKIAIVIGNEGNGIKDATKKVCKHKVIIPMKENVNSFNAAVAAGIVIWEVTKWR